MKTGLLAAGAIVAAIAFAPLAHAGTYHFQFSGAGVSGSGMLTITPDTVSGDPSSAFSITSVSGTFSDATLGISNAQITGLVPLGPPNSIGNTVPASMSYFPVTNPPPTAGGPALTYDNLFFPDGSPVDCPDFTYDGGGFLDVYGMMLTLDNGNIVDFWSDGEGSPVGAALTYGVGVIAPGGEAGNTLIDYKFAGVAATAAVPAPQYLWLLGAVLFGLFAWRRRSDPARATIRAGRRRY